MILQRALPYDPAPRRLPGVQPLDPATWLLVDEAYAAQMELREELMATCPEAVLAEMPGARPAAAELLETVLTHLPRGFRAGAEGVTCPDGRVVALDRDDPLRTAARLVQEDLCLMEARGDEHVLTAAALCFPASWMLAEKIGRPLTAIHDPVAAYDAALARRVQRLFDGVQAGRPLWRVNALWYADPALHQPRSVNAPRPDQHATRGDYLRSERQCLLRLPVTGAVVFSIHTYVLAAATLPDDLRSAVRG